MRRPGGMTRAIVELASVRARLSLYYARVALYVLDTLYARAQLQRPGRMRTLAHTLTASVRIVTVRLVSR